MDFNEFQTILSAFFGKDNEERIRMENIYWKLVKEDPSVVIKYHLFNIEFGVSASQRKMSLILLRRIYDPFYEQLFELISKETHIEVMDKLLHFFIRVSFPVDAYPLLSACVASVSIVYLDLGSYDSFFPSMIFIANDRNSPHSVPALDCIVQCIQYDAQLTEAEIVSILNLLNSTFSNDQHPQYIVSCLRLLYSLAPKKNIRAELISFAENVAVMLRGIPNPYLSSALHNLALFIALHASFFSSCIESIVCFLLEVCINVEMPEPCRLNALEAITQLVTRFDNTIIPYLRPIVEGIMTIMCEIDEYRYEKSEEDTSIVDTAEICLSSISTKTSIQQEVTSVILEIIDESLFSPIWQIVYASIVTIDKVLSGCSQYMIEYIEPIIHQILKNFSNENQICRTAAYYAFAQVSITFKPLPQNSMNEAIMESFLHSISNESYLQAKAAAIFALSVYCQHCSPSLLLQSSGMIIENLISMSRDTEPILENAILRCISVYAKILGNELCIYYIPMMNWLKNILISDMSSDSIFLRARAIEAFVYIGQCVDQSVFLPDAQWFVALSLSYDWECLSKVELEQMQTALGRIAIHTAESFDQFVDPVIKKLILKASHRPELQSRSQFDPDLTVSKNTLLVLWDSNLVELSLPELRAFESTLISIQIMLNSFGQAFVPYIDDLSTILLPACGWNYSPTTQVLVLQCYKQIITIVANNIPSRTSSYIQCINKIIFKMLAQKNEAEPIDMALQALAFGLTILIQQKICDSFILNSIYDQIPNLLINFKNNNNCDDEQWIGSLVEESIGNLMGILFQQFPESTSAFFLDKISPIVPIGAQPTIFSLQCWTFLLKYKEYENAEITQSITFMLLDSTLLSDYRIVHHAFILLGSLLESDLYDYSIISSISLTVLSTMNKLLSESAEKIAIDGALYTLTVLMNLYEELIDMNQCFPMWLHCLPFTTQIEKSKAVYLYLCDVLALGMVEMNDDNIKILLNAIGSVLDTPLIDAEIGQRLKQFIYDLIHESEYGLYVLDSIQQMDFEKSERIVALLEGV